MIVRGFFASFCVVFGLLFSHFTAAAPDLLLAKELPAQVVVKDYLISEKYDGVRAYWDGKALWFRGGGQIQAPQWFVDGLPPEALDGELWLAYGGFERGVGIVRQSTPVDADWRQIKYMVFELPNATGDFASRAATIAQIVQAAQQPYLRAVKQYRLQTREQVQRDLDAVVRAGGEGLMLHLASAPYQTGRVDVLYKLKPKSDAEAVVIGYINGTGKYTGMMGALRVRADDGREFSIGTGFSDETRRAPPAIGTVVTYKFRGLTKNGLPRFASYWRVRVDAK
jgi:DNA ligase-1